MAAFVTKQICFINLDTNVQNSLYATLPNRDGELDLLKTIEQFDSMTALEVRRIYYLDPSGLHLFSPPFILSREFFRNEPLIFYHRDQLVSATLLEDDLDQEMRKERNKERSIKEVIMSVKKWRSFHKAKIDGVRVSLLQAAELVGISKKSLDDYFCQLRLGEKYGFDFYANLNERIGMLRTFVKKNRPKSERNNRNEKHPKTLRIIDEFAMEEGQQMFPLELIRPGQRIVMESSVGSEQHSQDDQPMVEQAQEESLTPMDKAQEEELENQFFRLDMILDEPTDLFVHFSARDYRDFTRKEVAFDFPSGQGIQGGQDFMW